MRAAIVLVFAATACGQPTGSCEIDPDCQGDDVCARTGECLPRASVKFVRITWTVRGQPASATSCGNSQDLYLMFFGFSQNDTFGYQPVPCDAGLFTIDKLPTRYTSVEIGNSGGVAQEKVFDSQGNVAFDLAL